MHDTYHQMQPAYVLVHPSEGLHTCVILLSWICYIQYEAKSLAGKNIAKMTCFVLSET